MHSFNYTSMQEYQAVLMVSIIITGSKNPDACVLNMACTEGYTKFAKYLIAKRKINGVCVCVHAYMCVCMCACVYACVCLCVCVCVYPCL